MYNNGGNIFNSDIEKLFRYNNIKNVINNSSTDKIHRAINRYQYFFGSQNDITINNNQSIILKNTNDKNHKRLTKKDVESDKIRKALEILNKNNFFNESKDTTAKSLHEKTIQLQYKNMKNIHSNTSLTELEKNYNNLLKVREKGGYIIGFDTETIGGLNNRVWSPDMITEFGFKIDDLTKNTTKDINVLISSEFNANTGKISHQEKLKQIEAILSSENGLEKLKKDKARMKELYDAKEWYTIRSLLGNQWANWFIMAGARERGKTFSVQDFVLNSFFNPKSKLYKVPFYWMRLNDIAIKNMLMNNVKD